MGGSKLVGIWLNSRENRKLHRHEESCFEKLPCALTASGVVYLENGNRLFSSRLTYPEAVLFPRVLPLFSLTNRFYSSLFQFSPPFLLVAPSRKLSSRLSFLFPFQLGTLGNLCPRPGILRVLDIPFFIETDTFCFLYRHCGWLRLEIIAMQNTGECVSSFQRFIIQRQFAFDYCTILPIGYWPGNLAGLLLII